jgi:thiamine biosynthesis lipoprotein
MKKLSVILFFFLLLISCNKKAGNKKLYFQGEALGTTYHITAIKNEQSKAVNQKDIDSVIEAINNSLSTYRPNSLISRINKGEKLKVDPMFKEVYEEAKKIYINSGGVYDPTIGIIVNAWGFGPGKKIEGIEKDSSIVDSLMKFVGYNKLKLDSHGILIKKYPEMFIDYNSIAKGYAIDRVGKLFENKGYKDYLVEIGGEVLAKGTNSIKGRPWIVAIDNPDRQSRKKLYSKIELRNKAMATSGNYRKYYIDEETGKKYVHTINSKTGFPEISHLLSATIIADNCMKADGYATACMALGLEGCKKMLQNHPELKAFLIYSDEQGGLKTYVSSGLEIIK